MVVVWCIVRCASIHAGPPYGTCMANEVQPRRLFAAQKPRNPTGKALSERKRTCCLSLRSKSQGQIIRKRTLRIRINGTARFLCQNLSKCLHFFDYVQNRVAGVDLICRPIGAWGNDRAPSSARHPSLPVRYLLVIRLLSGLAPTRCRSPSYRVACPLGMVQVVLAVVRLSARSRIRSVPRRSFPAASLLSTPRSLATLSTGAFSCRRSRCLGRRLLPPSVVLVGRGSWARGVPRG